jgi:hypothetical protein
MKVTGPGAVPGPDLVRLTGSCSSARRRGDKAGASHLPREPSSSFFITSSTLKLAGFCRGGKSLKLEFREP